MGFLSASMHDTAPTTDLNNPDMVSKSLQAAWSQESGWAGQGGWQPGESKGSNAGSTGRTATRFMNPGHHVSAKPSGIVRQLNNTQKFSKIWVTGTTKGGKTPPEAFGCTTDLLSFLDTLYQKSK